MLLRYLSFWKRLLLVSVNLVLATDCSSEPNLLSTQVKSEHSDGGEARLIDRFAGSEESVDSQRTHSIAVSDYDGASNSAQELLPSNETNSSQIDPDPVNDPTAPWESVNASGSDRMNNESEIIDLAELDKHVTGGSEVQSSITSTDRAKGGSGQDVPILQSTQTSTPNPDQIVGVSRVVLGESSIQVVSEDPAEVIWDIAGNVSEWLDGGYHQQTWPVFSVSAFDWSSKDIPNSLRSTAGLSPFNNFTAGLGVYIGCIANGNALHVGGSYLAGTASGIYTIVMNAAQSYTSSDVGFRCVQN